MKNKRYSFKKIDVIKKEKEPLQPLFKRQALITSLSVLLVVVITLSGSFAVFTKTGEGTEYNVVQVGELELSYVDLNTEGNVLQLADSYPISDIDGEKATPYRFSVENTGTIVADYTVKIVEDTDTINVDGCSDNLIDDNYLRYKFDNEEIIDLDLSYSGNGEYIIYSGTLEPLESNIHEIRIWINENSPNSILGTHYHGKVVIDIEQNNITDPYERPKTFVENLEDKVDTTSTISFANISSETNGRGIYKYQEDGSDIYYWRGNIDAVATEENGIGNHVIFGGYCWEMIRTTKTGGIKMIYDGVPVDGKCENTGESSQLSGTHKFNSSYSDNAYVGYMYGLTGVETDANRCLTYDSENNIAVDSISTYPDKASCIEAGGKWTKTAYEATHANVVPSNIKGVVDTWFSSSTLNNPEKLSKIEDTAYCNDRSIDLNAGSGNGLTGYTILGYAKNKTNYNANARVGYNLSNPIPSLSCEREEDRFTVNRENGNGDLEYPVGLITADEIVLAGGKSGGNNSDYYLYNGQYYWTLSPSYFLYNAYEFNTKSDGGLDDSYVQDLYGVRPTIVLASGTNFSDGSGTSTNPYIAD